MNLCSIVPKANFNEEKQMLLVAYRASAERPSFHRLSEQFLAANNFSSLVAALFEARHGAASAAIIAF